MRALEELLKNAYAVVMTNGSMRLLLIGGPTALIDYGGLRFLTDPTFDPPGEHPRPGTNIVLRKLRAHERISGPFWVGWIV